MEKNGFILYQEYKKNLESLTQSQKGDLLDAIFAYNENQEVKLEPIVEMAFSFIKNDLDRNNKKWLEKKQERSESGRLGNLKRWNNDLFKQVQNNKISLEEADNIIKGRKKSPSDNSDSLKLPSDNSDSLKSLSDKQHKKIDLQFDEFWELYNFKHNKEQSRKAFRNALKIIKFEELKEAVKKYNEVRKEGYIFKPNNWLSGKHWEDELEKNNSEQEEKLDKTEFYKQWLKCYGTSATKHKDNFNNFINDCKSKIKLATFENWFLLNLLNVKPNSITFETKTEFHIDALMGVNNHCMNGNAKDIIFKAIKDNFGNKNLIFQYPKNNEFKQKEYKII